MRDANVTLKSRPGPSAPLASRSAQFDQHAAKRLVTCQTGDTSAMEQQSTPPPTPKDATEASEEQRELQEELDHQGEDPEGPALQQTRNQVADEY